MILLQSETLTFGSVGDEGIQGQGKSIGFEQDSWCQIERRELTLLRPKVLRSTS